MVYTANLVYTVNLIYTVNIVYTVDMIYTVDSSCTYILLRLLWVLIKCFRQLGETSLRLWRGQTLRWPGSPKNPEWILESGRCAKLTSRLSQYSSKIALLWQNGLIFLLFSTVLKRFCPFESKNVFVLVLAHLEPELELFKVWEILVLQIIINIIANVINSSSSSGSRWAPKGIKNTTFWPLYPSWRNWTICPLIRYQETFYLLVPKGNFVRLVR